jgi:RAT1-interacting protein
VVKTRLGGHSLLFGAEVDAVNKADSKPPWNSLEDFVELKTNRMIETQRQETSFRR